MASGYLQFIAGDYKEKYTLGVAIVGGKDLICANMFGKKLKLANIASFEVVTEENVKKFGTTLGTAALGGVLFGGAGAVVGAIAGGNIMQRPVFCIMLTELKEWREPTL